MITVSLPARSGNSENSERSFFLNFSHESCGGRGNRASPPRINETGGAVDLAENFIAARHGL